MTRVSIGTWAFGVYTEQPLPSSQVLDRITKLGFEGVELGAFLPHPDPATCATTASQAELRYCAPGARQRLVPRRQA